MRASILTALLLLAPITGATQDLPTLPARVDTIIKTLHERNVDLAQGDDNARRQLTRMIIEQTLCEFPTSGWVWKASSPGNPPSKDAIALQRDGRLYAWDWQDGTSRRPNTYPGKPANYDITGQHPIPLVCVAHLSAVPSPSSPQPAPVLTVEIDDKVLQLYAEFQQFKLEVREQWAAIAARDERIYADLAAKSDAIDASLLAHRKAVREGRNTVLRFLTNWRNLATIAAGLATGLGLAQ